MNVVDLSHTIKEEMQIYPGDPEPTIEEGLTHENDYCHVDRLNLGSHTGTHIDAPLHFIPDGKTIDSFPARFFVGSGAVVDARGLEENTAISKEMIEPYVDELKTKDFAIIQTGWDDYFGSEKYERHPYLSKEAAHYLATLQIRIVGVDFLNVDSTVTEQFDAHDVLLNRDILIVENLTNLGEVPSGAQGEFSFLPLKVEGTDGSPIRAIYVNPK